MLSASNTVCRARGGFFRERKTMAHTIPAGKSSSIGNIKMKEKRLKSTYSSEKPSSSPAETESITATEAIRNTRHSRLEAQKCKATPIPLNTTKSASVAVDFGIFARRPVAVLGWIIHIYPHTVRALIAELACLAVLDRHGIAELFVRVFAVNAFFIYLH